MSAEFVAALTEAFHKFDSNNDGRLSEQELKDVSITFFMPNRYGVDCIAFEMSQQVI